jgi:hypothetical protein
MVAGYRYASIVAGYNLGIRQKKGTQPKDWVQKVVCNTVLIYMIPEIFIRDWDCCILFYVTKISCIGNNERLDCLKVNVLIEERIT